LHWYVAYVRSCQERKVVEHLAVQGIMAYVPIQKEMRQWSDRVKEVDKLIIPHMVFVHCNEKIRLETLKTVYGITAYMMDRSSTDRRALVVPDEQMEIFMRVVESLSGESQVEVVTSSIAKGDVVRVVRGPLNGFVGECVELKGKHNLVIHVGSLGSLLVAISTSDVLRV